MIKDPIRRSVCLVLALVLAGLWWCAREASAPAPVPLLLAATGIAYAFAGLLGPHWLRWILLFGLMGSEGDSAD